MDSFHLAGFLLERYATTRRLDICIESFNDASAFLEFFIDTVGLGFLNETTHEYFDPTGEVLHTAARWFTKIESIVLSEERPIIELLGDRRQRCTVPKFGIDCAGITSHSCGVLVVLNLLGECSTDDPFDCHVDWAQLTLEQQQWFATTEQQLNGCTGPDFHALADGIQLERSLFTAAMKLKKSASDNDAEWPTITEVANGFNTNKGTLSRWIKPGGLRDNGKKGSERRIDPLSIVEYCKAKQLVYSGDPDHS